MDCKDVVRYWRSSIADAKWLNIKFKSENLIIVPREQILNGKIDQNEVGKLFKKTAPQKSKDIDAIKNLNARSNEIIDIVIALIVGNPVVSHGVKKSENKITPIWISAKLDQNGNLQPNTDNPPWIPRDYLDPKEFGSITIGEIEKFDEYLTVNPFSTKEHSAWNAMIEYAFKMFHFVHEDENELLSIQIENYYITSECIVLPEDRITNTTLHIIKLYDQIISQNHYPALLQRYANLEDMKKLDLLDHDQSAKQAALHYGQMSNQFSLGESQRESIHHILTIKDGEILAVNGPPGTGKTTLLQSVVTTHWITAAAAGEEPPVIVAASTNNQAVTNIIDSFGNTEIPAPFRSKRFKDINQFSKRWIQDIKSYGLYAPSETNSKKESNKNKYQMIGKKNEGFPSLVQTEEFITQAKVNYLSEFESNYGFESSLEQAIEYLQKQLQDVLHEIDDGVSKWYKVQEIIKLIQALHGGYEELKLYIDQKNAELQHLNLERDHARHFLSEWSNHLSRQPFWLSILSFLKWAKRKINQRNRSFLIFNDRDLEDFKSDFNTDHIQSVLDSKLNQFNEDIKSLKTEIDQVNEMKNLYESAMSNLEEWARKNELSLKDVETDKLISEIDTKLRFIAFQLATHYWEAKWIIETESFVNSGIDEEITNDAQMKKWRRYAKLTPCVVSTLHMAPKFFTARQPLYDFIDLLIIDEAGQVAPEIGGATFALAKKALVVGDVLQIEPVWNIPIKIDIGNLQKHGLMKKENEFDELNAKGILASTGNVMRIAQRASKYAKYDDQPGMFLKEHRRCVDEIIGYCNDLAYNGQLLKLRGKLDGHILPHMGYIDIQGTTKKVSGSLENMAEIYEIMSWLNNNVDKFCDHYSRRENNKRNPEDVVAIITPFDRQKYKLKEELSKHPKLKNITVGTVHALQGAERNIVIFSPVYDRTVKQTYFFDKKPNMLNVAVSRAKDSFIVAGDMAIFQSKSQNSKLPSALLGKYLFAKASNQIIASMID